jgi:hypothetical protein
MGTLDKEADKLLGEDAPKPEETQNLPTPTSQVLFMPTRAAAAGGGRAARKAPPNSRPRLTQEEIDENEILAQEREAFIASDLVVQNCNKRDPIALLNALKMEVAREQASMAFQRVINERNGRDSSGNSGKRIDALKKIADIELEMRKIGVDQIDVYSEKFQRVFKFWIEMIQAAAVATLGPEQSDLFFNRLTSEMEGWEDKAAEIVR